VAAMDGPNPALALQLLEQIRSQFPGSRRADRLTVCGLMLHAPVHVYTTNDQRCQSTHAWCKAEAGDGASGPPMSAGICACLCTI
jgi:hypothetical protein